MQIISNAERGEKAFFYTKGPLSSHEVGREPNDLVAEALRGAYGKLLQDVLVRVEINDLVRVVVLDDLKGGLFHGLRADNTFSTVAVANNDAKRKTLLHYLHPIGKKDRVHRSYLPKCIAEVDLLLVGSPTLTIAGSAPRRVSLSLCRRLAAPSGLPLSLSDSISGSPRRSHRHSCFLHSSADRCP
ncbi:ribulose bisphosphate carboxylase small chain 1A [Striga asiatica]|uniref:Ribulose bisphosphate carboxylase small chain 1A n=1 Tax=Striga asiatica TaxID=4170 RepID=A0A5A7PKT0_STRAF|nr:ribulose bisphosphate carboxylase small chain 1A [Striga asiatica]